MTPIFDLIEASLSDAYHLFADVAAPNGESLVAAVFKDKATFDSYSRHGQMDDGTVWATIEQIGDRIWLVANENVLT